MPVRAIARALQPVPVACALALVTATPAHAVATLAADTTRGSGAGDALAAGRSPSLQASAFTQTVLRFRVAGLAGPPAHAVLRLRVTAPTVETLAVRVVAPAFGEDDGTPAQLATESAPIASVAGAPTGTWAQWDVTSAVDGNGDVGLQVSGPLIDPASFSSREGADAPQLVVTPDDARAARLAGLLEPAAAEVFVAHARDDLDNSLDGLDVIAAPAGQGIPGRYVGVHHTLVGGTYVSKLATSENLTTWTHRADLDVHASQPTLAALPDGGFVLAFERDTPDPQYISVANLVVRHYAGWAALVAGTFDREANLPRTLAPTAEGTPSLEVMSWNGPDASQIAIHFHYLKNISVDRQAAGVLTNLDAAGWAPRPESAINDLFIALGTRGNLGDRADLSYEGHPYSVLEAQSIRSDFGAWRWYLYDRERGEARLLALRLPAGSYALGNPTARPLTSATGKPILLLSGYAFYQGAGAGEAGQFIAVRNATTAAPPPPAPPPPPPVVVPPPPAPVPPPPVPLAPPPLTLLPLPALVALDRVAPTVTVAARRQKLARALTIRISCRSEACRATTSATVSLPRVGRAKARTYTLRAVTKRIALGRRATARPLLSAVRRVAIRRVLRAHRRVVVTIRVRVADAAGNARTVRRQFSLKL